MHDADLDSLTPRVWLLVCWHLQQAGQLRSL